MLLTGVVDTLPKPQDYKYSPWCLSLSIPNKLRNNPKPENVFSNGWLWKIQSKHREKPWLSMRLFIKTSMLKQSAFLPGVVKHSNSMFQKFPPPQPGHLPVKRPDSLLKPYISLLQVLLLWSWFHCQTGAPPPQTDIPHPKSQKWSQICRLPVYPVHLLHCFKILHFLTKLLLQFPWPASFGPNTAAYIG